MRGFQPDDQIEKQISQLLSEFEIPEVVAENLARTYHPQTLNLQQYSTIANFFVNAGLFESFIQFFLSKIDDASEMPWGHVVHCLLIGTRKDEIPLSLKQEIFYAAELSGRADLFSQTDLFDEFRPDIEFHRRTKIQKAREYLQSRRKEIYEKLDIFRTQNLFDDEDRILSLLMLLEPDNRSLLDHRANLRNRMAQDLLARRARRKFIKMPSDFIDPLTEDEEKLLNVIFQSMQSTLQKTPGLAPDFAIALMTWEDYNHALEIIEKIYEPFQRLCLKAECLLLARKFIELLEVLDSMEFYTTQNPELLFNQSYLRAQALWGIDKKNAAIELLEQIIEARPHFRSAQALLTQWKENLIWLNE